jgi:hypothetical protein
MVLRSASVNIVGTEIETQALNNELSILSLIRFLFELVNLVSLVTLRRTLPSVRIGELIFLVRSSLIAETISYTILAIVFDLTIT